MSDARGRDMVRPDGVRASLGALGQVRLPLRQRIGAVVLVIVVATVTAFIVVNRQDRGPRPLGAEVRDPTTLVLWTTCADGVAARATESDESVRLDRISGDVKGDDCAGAVEIDLSAPIAGRTLLVEGNEWHRVDASCPYGELGPGGADVPPACR